MRWLVGAAVLLASSAAYAGPETALREFAGGQVKKGVRTIGMGGDGATTGNYALVYKDAGGAIFGLLRSYEYRLGVAYSPWKGTLFDVGAVALDRSDAVEHTGTFVVNPTIGAEQVLVPRHVWVRGGLDETTGTTGMSVAVGPFKIDVAYLYNLAQARTGDVFGKRNASLIATLGFDYARFFVRHSQPAVR